MGSSSAEADVIRIGDAAGERQKITVAQSVRPLFWRYKKIFSPGRPFEPAFATRRLDHMIGSLSASAEQSDNPGPLCLPPFLFGERQHHPALLWRQRSGCCTLCHLLYVTKYRAYNNPIFVATGEPGGAGAH